MWRHGLRLAINKLFGMRASPAGLARARFDVVGDITDSLLAVELAAEDRGEVADAHRVWDDGWSFGVCSGY